MEKENVAFPKVKLYIMDVVSCIGRVSLVRHLLGSAIYVVSDDSDSQFPFDLNKVVMSPLSDPILMNSGHFLFNLNYFSEITIMDVPPRCCLHDIIQEPSICLNFGSKETVNDFMNFLMQNLSFNQTNLPGFYSISRPYPPICTSPSFDSVKDKLKTSLIRSSTANDMLFMEAQNTLSPLTTPTMLHSIAKIEDLDNALKSKNSLFDLLTKKCLPNSHRGIAWALVINLPDFNNIDPVIMENFRKVKRQWISITDAQLRRSKNLFERLSFAQDQVNNVRSELDSICEGGKLISVTLSAIICVVFVYDEMFNKINELIKLVIQVLHMFIQGVDGQLFIIGPDIRVDSEKLEAAVFWSMIYLIEKCELKRLLSESDQVIASDFSDMLFLIHPQLLKFLSQKNLSNFECIAPAIRLMCCTMLESSYCRDIWLSACATDTPNDFIMAMIISATFLIFPNINASTEPKDFAHMIKTVFHTPGIAYLLSATHLLLKNQRQITRKNFPTLFN